MEETKTIDKVHEEFVNELISLGMTNEKALEISSTFFFAWVKSKGVNIQPSEYEKEVKDFLTRLKKTA